MKLYKSFSILSLATLLRAAGGVPMMTDGTGTPGDGNWEINLSYKWQKQGASKQYELPAFDINYGLGNNIQLKVESSYLTTSGTSGFSNAKTGVKWRFYEDESLSFSTYPQYTFLPVKKNYDKGIASLKEAVYLPISANKQLGSFNFVAEAGYLITKENSNYINTGFIVGYQPAQKLELLAEIYRSASTDASQESIMLNYGLTYAFTKNIGALFSMGREAKNRSNSKTSTAFVGVQLLF